MRSGDPFERIYFPLSGLIAFIMIAERPNGRETPIVGHESAVGRPVDIGLSARRMHGGGAGWRGWHCKFRRHDFSRRSVVAVP